MKALEWGFVVDRTPYVWTGLDSDLDVDLVGDGKEKTPLRKDPERLRAIQAKNAASDSRLDILVNTVHLFISMRGTGYAFGPSVKFLNSTASHTTPLRTFVKHQVLELAWSHAILVCTGIVMTAPHASRVAFLQSNIPGIPYQHLSTIASFITNLALGMGGRHGINLGYVCFTLSVLSITQFTILLPTPHPNPPEFRPASVPLPFLPHLDRLPPQRHPFLGPRMALVLPPAVPGHRRRLCGHGFSKSSCIKGGGQDFYLSGNLRVERLASRTRCVHLRRT